MNENEIKWATLAILENVQKILFWARALYFLIIVLMIVCVILF